MDLVNVTEGGPLVTRVLSFILHELQFIANNPSTNERKKEPKGVQLIRLQTRQNLAQQEYLSACGEPEMEGRTQELSQRLQKLQKPISKTHRRPSAPVLPPIPSPPKQ